MQKKKDLVVDDHAIVHSKKMEALGELVGVIAHDFRNIITAIDGYLDLALNNMEDQKSIQASIKGIMKCCRQGYSLMDELLLFSRKETIRSKPLGINFFLKENEDLYRKILSPKVEFKVEYEATEHAVLLDANLFNRVMMNLIKNSDDAMPKGGKITIRVRSNVYVDDDQQPYIVIEIIDTGMGIPHNIRNRIFEPYFTTKEPGKGTGFGLATSYGIVQQLGGTIALESTIGKGTTFFIYLPEQKFDSDDNEKYKANLDGKIELK